MVKELLPSPLLWVDPVAHLAIVDQGALDVGGRPILHVLGAFGRAEVPHGLHVLVVGQVLGDVVAVPGQDVDDSAGQV